LAQGVSISIYYVIPSTMGFSLLLLCFFGAVHAYDDSSLMQQNMGVEAASSSREKYQEVISAIQEGRKQFPKLGKLREMAIDGLMNDLTAGPGDGSSDGGDIPLASIFAQIHELLDSIDRELQAQKNTDQDIINGHNSSINQCSQVVADDPNKQSALQTKRADHIACRALENTTRANAEVECGEMTQEMQNRKAGTGLCTTDCNDNIIVGNTLSEVNFENLCTGFKDGTISTLSRKVSRPGSGDLTEIMDHEKVWDQVINPNEIPKIRDGGGWYASLARVGFWYDAVLRDLGPKLAPCEAALHAYAVQRVTCHKDQVYHEHAFCEFKQIREDMCLNRQSCYETAVSDCLAAWAVFLPVANQRYHEGSMVRYVKCLIGELEQNVTDIAACDAEFTSNASRDNCTESFNITPLVYQPADECDTSIVAGFPADDQWRSDNFNSFAHPDGRTPYNDDITASHCCANIDDTLRQAYDRTGVCS